MISLLPLCSGSVAGTRSAWYSAVCIGQRSCLCAVSVSWLTGRLRATQPWGSLLRCHGSQELTSWEACLKTFANSGLTFMMLPSMGQPWFSVCLGFGHSVSCVWRAVTVSIPSAIRRRYTTRGRPPLTHSRNTTPPAATIPMLWSLPLWVFLSLPCGAVIWDSVNLRSSSGPVLQSKALLRTGAGGAGGRIPVASLCSIPA